MNVLGQRKRQKERKRAMYELKRRRKQSENTSFFSSLHSLKRSSLWLGGQGRIFGRCHVSPFVLAMNDTRETKVSMRAHFPSLMAEAFLARPDAPSQPLSIGFLLDFSNACPSLLMCRNQHVEAEHFTSHRETRIDCL